MTYPDFLQDPARGCAPRTQVNPDIFYAVPRKAASSHERAKAAEAKRKAKAVCRDDCPFTKQCFAWANSNGEKYGIWGGVDMANFRDVARARTQYVITVATEPEPVIETDEDMAERVLSAGRAAYVALTDKQRVAVIQNGLRRGLTLNVLARQLGTSCRAMRELIGNSADGFEDQVRKLYHLGKSDSAIALTLGWHPDAVRKARVRMGLRALLGPGGRPRKQAVAVAA